MSNPAFPATHLTGRFDAAVAYASVLHATQVRKGTRVPYIAHLLGVASLVLEADGDEDMVIGGLLHDAAEDHGGEARLLDIADRFGPDVERYVRSCSDSLAADASKKEPWSRRKAAYLEHLAQADVKAVTVSTADKVHNARSIVTDLQNGVWVFGRFKAQPSETLAYYDNCLAIATAKAVSPALVTPLGKAVRTMRHELSTWPEADKA